MSIQKLIKEALAKSPLGVKAALEEELRVRVSEAVSGKMEDAALEEDADHIDESWSDGINSRTAHLHASKAAQYRKKARASSSAAKFANAANDEAGHNKHMAAYHSAMAKSIKSSYHAGEYGGASEAKKDHKQHMDLAKEYKNKNVSESVEQIDEAKAPKIACVKCDEVATSKAWEKNHGTCPHCKTSTQGVQESVEQIDELSKKTLVSYIKKASDNKGMHDRTIGRTFDKASREKSVNRAIGIRNAADRLAKEDVDLSEAVGMKDGYYVTNQRTSEITHDKPFADSKSAISHANKGENKTGYVHRVHKVKGGKIDKQWEYNGGHMDGGWEHFSDFKGDDARGHMRNIPKHFLHGND